MEARVVERSKKIQQHLEELKREIDTSLDYLKSVVENSTILVDCLQQKSNTPEFLKQYSRVNYCLSKYLNLVTDINCNFEILNDECNLKLLDDSGSSNDQSTQDVINLSKSKATENFSIMEESKVTVEPENSSTSKNKCIENLEKVDIKNVIKEEEKDVLDDKSNDIAHKKAVSFERVFEGRSSKMNQKIKIKVNETPKLPSNLRSSAPTFFPNLPVNIPFQNQLGQNNAHVLSGIPRFFSPLMHNIPPPRIHAPPQVIYPTNNPYFTNMPYPYPNQTLGCTPNFNICLPNISEAPINVIGCKPNHSINSASQTKKDFSPDIQVIEPIKRNYNLQNMNLTKGSDVEAKKLPKVKAEVSSPAKEFLASENNHFSIKSVNFSKEQGKFYDALFCNMVSPSEFYLHVLTPHLSLKPEMDKEIEKHFENPPKAQFYHLSTSNRVSKLSAKKQLGSYAMCHTVNSKWTRVEIIDWLEEDNNDKVRVLFVDYGDTTEISLNYIQPLDKKLASYPKFAQRCHLSDIYPVGSIPGKILYEWSQNAISVFSCILDAMKSNFACIIEICSFNGSYPKESLPVKLYLNKESSVSANEKMLTLDCAVTLSGTLLSKKIECNIESFKGLLSSYEKNSIGHNQIESDFDLTYVFDTPPEEGSIFPVQVTCLLHLNRFYCILDKTESDELQALVQEMNSNDDKLEILRNPPSLGDIVIGKYSEDEKWYRAKVINTDVDGDRYKLIFLDYGNTEIVSLGDIRKMNQTFLKLPVQLMKCTLLGVEPKPGVDLQTSMGYLQKKVEEGGLSIKIVSVISVSHKSEPTFSVTLYDQNGLDVALQMVEEDVARFLA